MTIFRLSRRSSSESETMRFIPMEAPPRPLMLARTGHPARSEPGTAAGPPITVGFLIAGAIIVGALAFWSGPGESSRDGVPVEQEGPNLPALQDGPATR